MAARGSFRQSPRLELVQGTPSGVKGTRVLAPIQRCAKLETS